MAKRRVGIMILLLWLCLSGLFSYAQAASTADAKEPISIHQSCTLTLNYRSQDEAFAALPVALYQIARVSEDGVYTLTEGFASSGVTLNGVRSNSEWDRIRSTLEAHILAESLTTTQSGVTDEKGMVSFQNLEPGLYLTGEIWVQTEEGSYCFGSSLTALPGLSPEGLWQYEVTAAPKSSLIPPTTADEVFQILKLWKGDEGKTDRPETVEVEIFRNGISYQTVTLSARNQWSYSWTAEADGANWTVVERNIPTGYRVTVEERDTTFILTNTWQSQPPKDPPKTGDTFNLLFYILVMYVAGILLVLVGIAGKRQQL